MSMHNYIENLCTRLDAIRSCVDEQHECAPSEMQISIAITPSLGVGVQPEVKMNIESNGIRVENTSMVEYDAATHVLFIPVGKQCSTTLLITSVQPFRLDNESTAQDAAILVLSDTTREVCCRFQDEAHDLQIDMQCYDVDTHDACFSTQLYRLNCQLVDELASTVQILTVLPIATLDYAYRQSGFKTSRQQLKVLEDTLASLCVTMASDRQYSMTCAETLAHVMCNNDAAMRQNSQIPHGSVMITKDSADIYKFCLLEIKEVLACLNRTCSAWSLKADLEEVFPGDVCGMLQDNLRELNGMRLACIDQITQVRDFEAIKDKRAYYRLLSCCDLGIRSHLASLCAIDTPDAAFGVIAFGVHQILNYKNDTVHLSQGVYEHVQAGIKRIHVLSEAFAHSVPRKPCDLMSAKYKGVLMQTLFQACCRTQPCTQNECANVFHLHWPVAANTTSMYKNMACHNTYDSTSAWHAEKTILYHALSACYDNRVLPTALYTTWQRVFLDTKLEADEREKLVAVGIEHLEEPILGLAKHVFSREQAGAGDGKLALQAFCPRQDFAQLKGTGVDHYQVMLSLFEKQ